VRHERLRVTVRRTTVTIALAGLCVQFAAQFGVGIEFVLPFLAPPLLGALTGWLVGKPLGRPTLGALGGILGGVCGGWSGILVYRGGVLHQGASMERFIFSLLSGLTLGAAVAGWFAAMLAGPPGSTSSHKGNKAPIAVDPDD